MPLPIKEEKKRKKRDYLMDSWTEWKEDPSEEHMSEMLSVAEPIISSATTSFAGHMQDPVVDAAAKRLAVGAFKSYDPKRASLNTHVFNQLAPLQRVVHRRAQMLKIPKQAWLDMQNLDSSREMLLDKKGQEPSVAELADATGLSKRRIGYLEKFKNAGIPEGILRERDPRDVFRLGEEQEDSWWAEAVYHSIEPRDQKIYDWRTGAHGVKKLSNKEIARKLGISEAAVSQRVSKLITLLEAGVQ